MRNGANSRAVSHFTGVSPTLLSLELVAVALAASLGVECTSGLALLEPIAANLGLSGSKWNFMGCVCVKQNSKIC